MSQVIRSPKVYDVCPIGSGAAGGAAAKVLTESGVNVVMLEAGQSLNPAKGRYSSSGGPWPNSRNRLSWARSRNLNSDKLMASKLQRNGKTTLYRKLKEYGAGDRD